MTLASGRLTALASVGFFRQVSEPPAITVLSWELVFWVQVWATAASNVVSALLGLVGVAYVCFLITRYRPAQLFCQDETWGDVTPTDRERSDCLWKISLLDVSWSSRENAVTMVTAEQTC